jgi:signal transduction histidine kinase
MAQEVSSLRARQADLLRELEDLRLEVAELRASRKRLHLLHDAERRSIERALHDGVQQQLVGLAADLERAAGSLEADPSSTTELFAEMRRDLEKALENARALADRIFPPLLERGGLVPALRTAAAAAGVKTRIDTAAGTVYPTEVAHLVYSCCVDVLDRAPAGTRMTITMRNEKDVLAFEIGFDRDLDVEGLSLRDRCEALGGHLSSGSESDHRTRLIGTVPLSA